MADDWDALALEVKAETEAQSVKRNLTGALGTNPDKQAEINKLSAKSGVPAFSIDSPENEAWVKNMTRMNDLNPDELVKTHPMTAKALQNENFAKIAHDDVENLKGLEDSFSTIGKTSSSTVDEILAMTEKQAAYAGLIMLGYGPDGQDIDAMAQFIADRNRPMADVQANAPEYQKNFQKRMSEADGWLESAGVILTSPRAVARSTAANLPNMILPSLASVGGAKIGAIGGASIGAGVATALGQAGPQVATPEEVVTVPAGAAIGGTIGGISGGVTGGFAGGTILEVAAWIDQELSDSGIDVTDPKAIAEKFRDTDFISAVKNRAEAKGLTTAGIDALWNATFAGRFAKGMVPVGKIATKEGAKALTKNVGKAATDIGVGAVGESVSEAGGQLAATGKVDAGDVLLEGFSSLGQSAFDTKMYSDIRKGDVDRAAKAVAEQKLSEVQAVHDAAMKVQTVARDPAAIREMVESAKPESRVYIDGEVVSKYYQELDTETKAALNAAIPDIEERINDANLSGGDVMLNRSDYVAYIASNEGGRVLMEYVKFDSPDDLTVAQLSDPDYLQSLYDLSPKDNTPLTDIEAFREEITQKLRDTGRIGTQQIARESVAPIASFIQTMRERGGSEAVTQSLLQGFDVQGPVAPPKSSLDITDKTINDMREYKTRTDTLFNAREKSLQTRNEKAKAKAEANGMVYRPAKQKEKGKSRHLPVLKYLAQMGGVKVGSPLAGELKAMDVTPKTAPWLFRKEDMKIATANGVQTIKALTDVDTINADDLNETIGLDVFRNDVNGYYVDVQDLMDAIDSELRGNPVVPENKDPVEAAYEDFTQYLSELGLDIETATNDQIKDALDAYKQQDISNNKYNEFDKYGYKNEYSLFSNNDGHYRLRRKDTSPNGDIVERELYDDGIWYSSTDAIPSGVSPLLYSKNQAEDAIYAYKKEQMQSGDTFYQNGMANTDSEAFKKWFGDSKVVDKDGNPLVVYHGTPNANFDQFSYDVSPVSGSYHGKGFYFTTKPDEASQYSLEQDGSAVIPVYLSIKNPYEGSDFPLSDTERKFITDKIGDVDGIYNLTFSESQWLNKRLRDAGVDVADLRTKTLLAHGFDGQNVGDGEWVAFSPTQIKSVNNRGTFDPNDARILYQSPVNDENLMVVHNLSAKNLVNANKVGGLAIPSLAVTRTDIPFDSFGDITLIAPPSLADPQADKANKVFDADVYSPRYPSVIYETNSKKINPFIDLVSKLTGDIKFSDIDRIKEDVSEKGIDGLLDNRAVKYAYLAEKGEAPEVVYREKKQTIVDTSPAFKKFVGRDSWSLKDDPEFLAEVKNHADKMIKEDKSFERVYYEDGELNRNIVRSYASTVQNYTDTPEVDTYETGKALDKLPSDDADYKAWVESKTDGVVTAEKIFNGFTASGTRRYLPHNLDNVVKLMKGSIKGGEGFNYGVPSIRAVLAKKFKSLKDIKKDSDRLITSEQMDAVKEEIGKDFDDLWDRFSQKLQGEYKFGDLDNFSSILTDIAKNGRFSQLSSFYKDVSQDDIDAVNLFLQKLKNLPTQYFEVKVQRPVNINEFVGAIVADNTPKDALKILDDNNIPYTTYKRSEDGDRAKVTDSFVKSLNEKQKVLFQKNRGQVSIMRDGRYVVKLFETSNLSTFLHETGHVFLDAYNRYAEAPDAPKQFTDDMAGILDYLGVKSYAEVGVEQHEKFARAFENYLRSGEAPSVALQSAFQKFKAWLSRIYQTIQELRAPVTPELKDIFDRMLATDDEIAQVQSRNDGFKINEDLIAILPKADQERYERLHNKSLEEAKENLFKKALKQKEREYTQWWKEERAKVRAEMELQVNTDPLYRTIEFLTKGKYLEGDEWVEMPPIKIAREDGIKILGKTIMADMPKGMFSKNGISADSISQLMGYMVGNGEQGYRYATGYELLYAITNAEDRKARIERLTNETMIERHGDMMTDGTIEKQAIEAWNTDSQALKMELEGKAAAKLAGLPFGSNTNFELAAQKILASKNIRDATNVDRFYVASVRAAKAYGKAIRSKDYPVAVKAKQQQLLSHHLYKQSVQARRELDKSMQEWKRLQKPDEKLSKSIDLNYIYVARAILGRYGVLPFNAGNLQTYFAYIQDENPEAYNDLILAVQENTRNVPQAETRDVSYTKGKMAGQTVTQTFQPWTKMSLEEFRGLKDTIDNIIGVGRNQKTMTVDGEKVQRETVIKELNDRLSELPPSSISDGQQKALEWHDKGKLALSGVRAGMRRVENWVNAMDGEYGGVFRKYIWNPINDARGNYLVAKHDYLTKMAELLKPYDDRLNNSGEIFSPEINYTFKSRAELIGMVLHMGNESNWFKLWKGGRGREWNPANVQTMMERMMNDGTISKEDMDLVQSMWDLVDGLKPDAQKAHKAMYGYYFSEITSWPVPTPWGEYRGGYWPAIPDNHLSQDARIRQSNEDLITVNNASMFPTTGRGFTKSRSEGYAAPLSFDLKLLPSHVDKVLRFVYLEPAVKDVAKLTNDKGFRNTMAVVDPRAIEEMLIPWLQRVARQTVETNDSKWFRYMDPAARWLRASTSAQVMMLNFLNAIQQVTGFAPAMYKVGARPMGRALVQYMKNPRMAHEKIYEASSFMRYRNTILADNMQKAVIDVVLDTSKYAKVKDAAQAHGYIFQKVFQSWVDGTTWMAAYDNALTKNMNEKEAVRHADSIVRETQGSTAAEDISKFEAGPATMRLFTMFYSYFNTQANLITTEAQNIVRSSNGFDATKKLGYLYMMTYAIPSFMAELIVRGMKDDLPDDEDDDGMVIDDWFAWFFGSQVRYGTAMVPFIGQVINSAVNALDDKPYNDKLSLSPVANMGETLARTPKAVYQAIADDGDVSRAVKDGLTSLGFITGLPLGQLGKPLGYAADVAEGDTEIDSPLDPIRGIIAGPQPADKR